MSLKKWTPEITKSLVEFYKLQPGLYDVSSVNYRNKAHRFHAIKTIKVKLKTLYNVDFTEPEVVKKINNLRSQLMECLRTQKKTSDTTNKTVWWMYDHLQFLLPHCKSDKRKSNIKPSTSKLILDSENDQDIFYDETSEDFEDLHTSMLGDTTDIHSEEQFTKIELLDNAEDDAEILELVPSPASSSTSEQVLIAPPPKKSRKCKHASVDVDEYLKEAIDKIANSHQEIPTSASSSIPPEVKSLCCLIETELAAIKNKSIFRKVKWDILDLVRKAQEEDDEADRLIFNIKVEKI